MLLEKIVYVVEIVSISGRTTAVVHAVTNCYAPIIIQTYDTPSFRPLARFNSTARIFCSRQYKNLSFRTNEHDILLFLCLPLPLSKRLSNKPLKTKQ